MANDLPPDVPDGDIGGSEPMKIFGRNPTLWIAVISNVVILGGTLGFGWLSGPQAVLVVAAIDALAGAVNAWTVRPIAPAAFTYAVTALVALAGGYGFNLTVEQVAGINSVMIAILALLTYGNVSPQETPITSA